ncbi:type I-E CRISPR-associated endoribonuclease Cas2e [Bordetella sp. 2513F-2]
MPLVVIVTRDVPDRFRGFLSSTMLEVAPATYVSPHMSKGVRERIWKVLQEWHEALDQGSVIMIWRDNNATGGVGLSHLGTPPKKLLEVDGMWIARKSG